MNRSELVSTLLLVCKELLYYISYIFLYREHTKKLQAAPITVHVALNYKSHIYELTAVLPHTGGDRLSDCLWNRVLPDDGPVRPKHVAVCVLKRYCNYNEACDFVCLHCMNLVYILTTSAISSRLKSTHIVSLLRISFNVTVMSRVVN